MTSENTLDGEDREAHEETFRPGRERDQQLDVFDSIRINSESPVQPVKLTPGDSFRFRCHRGVSCWNKCCHGADITLAPYDILRLTRHFGLRPTEFLERYTVPAEQEAAAMPVAKLKMGGDDGKGACPFLAEEGCTAYADRPGACRYYPLGLISVKLKDSDAKEDFNFLVREEHCRGHDEENTQTVADFLKEQGVEPYEHINRGWIDILMKLASWRPTGGFMGKAPTPQARQMFFMVSTDVERLRKFVFESSFLQRYEIPAEALEIVRGSDEALICLGLDWMKNVLFNEPTLDINQRVLQDAIAKARSETGAA
jgi:uncharacterized protein